MARRCPSQPSWSLCRKSLLLHTWLIWQAANLVVLSLIEGDAFVGVNRRPKLIRLIAKGYVIVQFVLNVAVNVSDMLEGK